MEFAIAAAAYFGFMPGAPSETASRFPDLDLETLKAVYGHLSHERDRLRDARASFTRQLGPLPISAGIAFGIVSGFSTDVAHEWLLVVALVAFGLMVVMSVLYSRLQPYRQLRAGKEQKWREQMDQRYQESAKTAEALGLRTEDVLPESDWYAEMIRLERLVYGELDRTRNRPGLPRRSKVTDLQDALDRERTGLYLVQALFVVVIVCLVLSRLT